jgi:SAM-dependent methyltransferase
MPYLKAALKTSRFALKVGTFGIRNESELRQYLQMIGGIKVLSGPFHGLSYLDMSHGSVWAPKVLGTYEQELHELIYSLPLNSFKQVVDIGCAEGYYLAGLAYFARKLGVGLPVEGFDLNPEAVQAANWLCRINALNAQAHTCRYELASSNAERTLFIIDIEGDETELLTAPTLTRLKSCSFILEVHENPESKAKLNYFVDLFNLNHEVQVIRRENRKLANFPTKIQIPLHQNLMLEMMNEHRERGNAWIFAQPKN